MSNALSEPAFWALTINSAKDAVRLYFDPLRRLGKWLRKRLARSKPPPAIPTMNLNPSVSWSADTSVLLWARLTDEDLERYVERHQEALAQLKESDPAKWAKMMADLGFVYQRRRWRNQEGLERAILFFAEALTVIRPESDPIRWARVGTSLGALYQNRVRGDREANRESAIALLERALTILKWAADPIQWALVTARLARAYQDRLRGQPDENLERAITLFEEALTSVPEESARVERAEIMRSLAQAYSHRVRGEPLENLRRAIALYEGALKMTIRTSAASESIQTETPEKQP